MDGTFVRLCVCKRTYVYTSCMCVQVRTFAHYGELVGQVREYAEEKAVNARALSNLSEFANTMTVTVFGDTVPALGSFRVEYANGVCQEWLSWDEVLASAQSGPNSHGLLGRGPLVRGFRTEADAARPLAGAIEMPCTAAKAGAGGQGEDQMVAGAAPRLRFGALLPDVFERPKIERASSEGACVVGAGGLGDVKMKEEDGDVVEMKGRLAVRRDRAGDKGGRSKMHRAPAGVAGDRCDEYAKQIKDVNVLLLNQPPLPLVLDVKQLVEVEDRGWYFPARVLHLDEHSNRVKVSARAYARSLSLCMHECTCMNARVECMHAGALSQLERQA